MLYGELEQGGELEASVYAAQERTSDTMDHLLDKGVPYQEAWELARNEWAYPPSDEAPD